MDSRQAAAIRRRSSLTTRAIALGVVLLILTMSYASSLRIYFAQQQDIAATKAEIAERKQRIEDLQTDVARWEDPAYVKSQAKERLGWVVPGETGYKVIGPDGKPIGGGAEIDKPESDALPDEGESEARAWWSDLWGSVQAADDPNPAPPTPKPSDTPPITEDTKPDDGG